MYDIDYIRSIIIEVLKESVKDSGFLLEEDKNLWENMPGGKEDSLQDIALMDLKEINYIDHPENKEFLLESKQATPARIGMYRSGYRANTKTSLRFRADHASSLDAVFTQVSQEFLEDYQLQSFQTLCQNKDEHITRPDLGRLFHEDILEAIRKLNPHKPDVLVVLSDGLSSKAVEANGIDAMLVINEGLKAKGFTVGKPFFVQFGRVGIMDAIAEAVEPKVVCLLIGERPGLVTAKSMSAYIAYKPYVNMPEAKRSVISNIHRQGTLAVEAGAHIVELIEKMIQQKASGLDLRE